jgi:transcriptional regulator with XRE-family HTH domain
MQSPLLQSGFGFRMPKDAFSEELRRLRKESGLTQEEVSVAADVPISTYRNWEGGHRRPELAAAYRLAKALGVEVSVLAKLANEHPLRKKRESGEE